MQTDEQTEDEIKRKQEEKKSTEFWMNTFKRRHGEIHGGYVIMSE